MESFDGFCAFEIPAGHHEITISYLPPGFLAGCLISLISLILMLLFLLLPKFHEIYTNCCKKKLVDQISLLLMIFAGSLVFVMIYVFPMIIYILQKLHVTELI